MKLRMLRLDGTPVAAGYVAALYRTLRRRAELDNHLLSTANWSSQGGNLPRTLGVDLSYSVEEPKLRLTIDMSYGCIVA